MHPEHPIYIVSKGRWALQLTSQSLAALRVPHFIVIEEEQYRFYAEHLAPHAQLLILDKAFQRDYETCDDLGDTKSKGPGPARNFAWAHALASGATWHWVMDDNIDGFLRLWRNHKIPAETPTIFYCMEHFCNRYENVVMGGPNYDFFAKRKQKIPPFITNTRIYSCNLIRNDVSFRWRGRYNEDTDLSLRILKAGLCTIQFNAFLQCKTPNQVLPGGNTEEFYRHEGTAPKSAMQVKLHPDVSRVVQKFSRVHHHVDYSDFKLTRLRRRQEVTVQEGPNEFGMVLEIMKGVHNAAL